MTERERKARVFPQGMDWFWGIWCTVFATHGFIKGIWVVGILQIVLGVIILVSRYQGRIWGARADDARDQTTRDR